MQRTAISLVLFLLPAVGRADVKPMSLFSDNMVLQRDVPLAVWGTAAAGEEVAVALAGAKARATADAQGRWMAKLPPQKAGGPFEMTIIGKNTVTIKNVLVGEVWLASGQSNMDMKLSTAEGGAEAVRASGDPSLRLFMAGLTLAAEPARDVRGAWRASTPQETANWSAAAYFFARELRQTLGVPVGILQVAQGWTPAEAWTSRKTLLADPQLKIIADRWDLWSAATPGARQLHEKKLAEWKQAAEQTKAAGKPAPPQPPAPASADFMHRASSLYNGMIAPLTPYPIRGVIWYQGETNASRADQYRRLFPAMIRDWRTAWGLGDFPFLFVQIAPLDTGGGVDRAELRDAQREALAVANTAMVVTLDIGEAKDEHPKNKKEVGRRLALAAQKLAYRRDVAYSGPLYREAKIEEGRIRVRFEHVDGGLAAKDGRLSGFTIAGEDRKFVPAEARIEGNEVVVWAQNLSAPKAVRYAWANYPQATLQNKAGLPASGFRTDDWPLSTRGEWKMFFEQINLDERTLTPRSER
jgi:sialate O-acetylesterase